VAVAVTEAVARLSKAFAEKRVEKMIKDENGYTIIEIVVAMGMVSIIAGLAFMVYNFSLREMRNWRERLAMENSAHIVVNALANDIIGMQQLLLAESKALKFIRAQGDTAFISIMNDSLLIQRQNRFTKPLVSEKSYFNYFKEDLNRIKLIEIVLVLGGRGREFEITTSVGIRNQNL
jgi:type II secretory pathway component PulJ